eukprot:TRINITY_DN1061_c0_g1_i1.p1 TRINITY_DN1061_c0_g1~~TRINITY_DN1061_c0_g1_i1.p1  ORF type:complete len:394 (+),score=93.95 TRINITY_DN1061_c0_g1_i1:248-1429(+)
MNSKYCLHKKGFDGSARPAQGGSPSSYAPYRLSLMYTNMLPEEEMILRRFMLQKVTKNLVYKSGTCVVMNKESTENDPSVNTVCYFALIELSGKNLDNFHPEEETEAAEETPTQTPTDSVENESILSTTPTNTSFSDVMPQTSREYILSLICETDDPSTLNLFHMELGEFCDRVSGVLEDEIDGGEPGKVQSLLSVWYSQCVEYIGRCIDVLDDDFSALIYHSLLGGPIIVNGPASFFEDISRLIKTISIVNEDNVTSVDEDIDSNNLGDSMYIYYDTKTNKSKCKGAITNGFCRNWALKLKNEPTNPIKLRNMLEDLKFKVIQELNIVRKMAVHGKLSNYALYSSVKALSQSNNADVLLQLLLKDQSNERGIQEVLEVLFEFVHSKKGTPIK